MPFLIRWLVVPVIKAFAPETSRNSSPARSTTRVPPRVVAVAVAAISAQRSRRSLDASTDPAIASPPGTGDVRSCASRIPSPCMALTVCSVAWGRRVEYWHRTETGRLWHSSSVAHSTSAWTVGGITPHAVTAAPDQRTEG